MDLELKAMPGQVYCYVFLDPLKKERASISKFIHFIPKFQTQLNSHTRTDVRHRFDSIGC